jgi:Na+-driven multidrug efflux pump
MPASYYPIGRKIRATLALATPLASANLAQMAMGLTNAIVSVVRVFETASRLK